ncbi:MAG: ribonuclease PH [Myxococcota bacterium]
MRKTRKNNQMREIQVETEIQKDPAGSVLISFGQTKVLCSASVEERVPRWLDEEGKGWVTAEYAMLPGSTGERKSRRIGGREKEIQRLVGRSLRASVDLKKIGERTITIDCDVIQADGGTRTASITGGYIALSQSIRKLMLAGKIKELPLKESVASVSCAIIDGEILLDPDYKEDFKADVDMNFVFDGNGNFVEVQGTVEGKTFAENELLKMIEFAKKGSKELTKIQSQYCFNL